MIEHAPSGHILALYGPSGVGKSTIRRLLTSACSSLVSAIPLVTTRGEKAGDEGEYVYVDQEAFSSMRDSGQLVAATSIPSSSELRWYGYRGSDIDQAWRERKAPIVIAEEQLLRQLSRCFGRERILSFGLLPPGNSRHHMLSSLLYRLRSRGRETPEQIDDRLKNAEADLALMRHDPSLFDHVIVNDHLPSVITKLETLVPRCMAPSFSSLHS